MESFNVNGSKAFILQEKLERLREMLIWWNNEVFGWVDLRLEKYLKDLNMIYNHLASINYNNIDEWRGKRRIGSKSIWDSIHLKESIIRQKSRNGWIKEGDVNTRFFHAILKHKYRKNSILPVTNSQGVQVEGGKCQKEIKNFFEAKFGAFFVFRLVLDGMEFNQLPEVDRDGLEEEFSDEEIR